MNKVFTFVLIGVLSIFTFTNANAFEKGDFDLTLAGGGVSDKDWNGGAFALTIAPGYLLSDEVEVGVRQSLAWASVEDGEDSVNGSTTAFVDYHFTFDQWKPFIGLSTGYAYGDAVEDEWTAGPEAGVKYFVNETTYLYGLAQYLFPLDDGFDDGAFVYGLGVGFKF